MTAVGRWWQTRRWANTASNDLAWLRREDRLERRLERIYRKRHLK